MEVVGMTLSQKMTIHLGELYKETRIKCATHLIDIV